MANKRFRIVAEILLLIRRKIRNMNVKLAITCLLISAIIWILSNLFQSSSKEFVVPVVFENPPEGLILMNRPDSLLTLELTAGGWDMLTSDVGSQEATRLDISSLKPQLKGRYYAMAIPTSYFKKDLISLLGVDKVGNEMQPDSLFFVFDDLIQKRVPVRAKLSLDFKQSYSQKGSIRISPDSVTITGPASEIREVQFVETEPKEETRLDGTVDLTLKCLVPYDKVNISHNEVKAHIEVDQFTEGSFKVPVRVDCAIPGIRIKTYPPEVEVKFLVALRDFESVIDTAFHISVDVDSLSLLRKDPLIPHIKQSPTNVRNVRLSHETLDFVIIKE